jgi:hypothetical protein
MACQKRRKKSVSKDKLRENIDQCFAAARNGHGPVAVLHGSEVMGYLVSPEDYEVVCGAAIRKLLKERIKGPTVSQEEARTHIDRVLNRKAPKP